MNEDIKIGATLPKPGNELLVRQWPILWIFIVVFCAGIVTLGWVLDNVLLQKMLSRFAGEWSGIVTLQVAGFVAFLVIASLQFLAANVEDQILLNKTRSRLKAGVMSSVGLPLDWFETLKEPSQIDSEKLSIALIQHASSRLMILRLLSALFPISGFIGTVYGIREAIRPLEQLSSGTGEMLASLGEVLSGLEFAFDTTLIGLVFFAIGSIVTSFLAGTFHTLHTRLIIESEENA